MQCWATAQEFLNFNGSENEKKHRRLQEFLWWNSIITHEHEICLIRISPKSCPGCSSFELFSCENSCVSEWKQQYLVYIVILIQCSFSWQWKGVNFFLCRMFWWNSLFFSFRYCDPFKSQICWFRKFWCIIFSIKWQESVVHKIMVKIVLIRTLLLKLYFLLTFWPLGKFNKNHCNVSLSPCILELIPMEFGKMMGQIVWVGQFVSLPTKWLPFF